MRYEAATTYHQALGNREDVSCRGREGKKNNTCCRDYHIFHPSFTLLQNKVLFFRHFRGKHDLGNPVKLLVNAQILFITGLPKQDAD